MSFKNLAQATSNAQAQYGLLGGLVVAVVGVAAYIIDLLLFRSN